MVVIHLVPQGAGLLAAAEQPEYDQKNQDCRNYPAAKFPCGKPRDSTS